MTKIKRERKAKMTMGLPGAGKSYIIERDYSEFKEQATIIDPDLEKKNHPDYDPENPAKVHEWSKRKAKARMAEAMVEGENMIIDGTGTNAEKMVRWIGELHSAGYEVELVYVSVKLKTALKRNQQRERVVPEEIILEKADLISTSFEIVSRYVDQVTVIEND